MLRRIDEIVDGREVLLFGWMVGMLLLMGYTLCHIWLLAYSGGAFFLRGIGGWRGKCRLSFGLGFGLGGRDA